MLIAVYNKALFFSGVRLLGENFPTWQQYLNTAQGSTKVYLLYIFVYALLSEILGLKMFLSSNAFAFYLILVEFLGLS